MMQSANPRQLFLLLFAVPVLCGGCCWAIGGAMFVAQQVSISHANHTTGTVLGLSSRLSTSTVNHHTTTSMVFAPIVAFRTSNEKLVTYTANIFTAPAAYQVGQTVDVYYDPNNPETNVTIGGQANGVYAFFGLGGLFILVFGILGVISFRRTILRAVARVSA